MTMNRVIRTVPIRHLAAIGMVLAAYAGARFPEASADTQAALAGRFAFTAAPLPSVGLGPTASAGSDLPRQVRAVHPSVAHISAWISSVGAAVALHDLDGDGLANDYCLVDPRTDRVTVAPVPGTGERYAAFTLEPDPGTYAPGTYAPMGCLPADLNADGRPDLLVPYWGRTPVAFLRRSGLPDDDVPAADVPAAAAYRPVEIMAPGAIWNTNTVTFADIDGDGRGDLVIGNYFRDGERVLDPAAGGLITMQDSMSRAANGGINRILLGAGGSAGPEPTVRFREAVDALPLAIAGAWTLAVGAADLDGDLRPEIYFANDFGPDRLLHNRSTPGHVVLVEVRGQRGPTTPRSRVVGRDSFKGMGVDFGDIDGDGVLDIAVSNIATPYGLLESHFAFLGTGDAAAFSRGIAPYRDESESLGLARGGWGWEARLGDFDGDGGLELVRATGFLAGRVNRWPELQELATGNDGLLADPRSWPRFTPGDDLSGHQPNAFFARGPNGRFVDIARAVGLGSDAVARGIATADVDGDGDLDLAVANQWAPSVLYRNDSPRRNAVLVLDLRLPVLETDDRELMPLLDRPAIGAEARVQMADGRVLVGQVDGGGGHSGERSPELHFGLGDQPPGTPVLVDLRWRDAAGEPRQARLRLGAGRHRVRLDADIAKVERGGS